MLEKILPEYSAEVFSDNGKLDISGNCDVVLSAAYEDGRLALDLKADSTPVRFIRLTWKFSPSPDTLYVGDAWERTYGDLQWRTMDASRLFPWYVLMKTGHTLTAAGVKTGAAAFALWCVSPHCLTLWLDVRCGSQGVLLQGRTLRVATIVFGDYEEATLMASARAFCRDLAHTAPLPPPFPIYGANNWYYAYGNSSKESLIRDAAYISRLTEGLENRPFMVIDDGWETSDERGGRTPDEKYEGVSWRSGNYRHGDMGEVAAGMRAQGCHAGIWWRPLLNTTDELGPECRLSREKHLLDPSRPEVLAVLQEDIRQFAKWGFELVKHDFSTYDMFGKWAFEMRPWPADKDGGWAFADTSRTSAEIISDFYKALHEADEKMIILGCNTIGHLGVGLIHQSRTGDDTSGWHWERTRKMGVNTLAFRIMQHRIFFEADADCAGVTPHIPWRLNAEWIRLVAESGTPLFVSIQPGLLSPEQEKQVKDALAIASRQTNTAEPAEDNWLWDCTPENWLINGKQEHFTLHDPLGGGNLEFI